MLRDVLLCGTRYRNNHYIDPIDGMQYLNYSKTNSQQRHNSHLYTAGWLVGV